MLGGPLLTPPRPRRWGRLAAVAVFVLACLGGLAAVALETGSSDAPSLTAYVQHGLSVRPVRSGAVLAAGDTVALTYSAGKAAWVGIWVQAGPATHRLYAGPAQAGEGVVVPHPPMAVQLTQTFYAMFCPSEAALDGVDLSAAVVRMPGCVVESVRLTR